MNIPFVKAQGTGNDFIIIDALGDNKKYINIKWQLVAKNICSRRFGVGADGILIITDSNKADARMIIINSDGSNGDICGNGLRCVAKYIIECTNIKPQNNTLTIETNQRVVEAKIKKSKNTVDSISINMGSPILESKKIPVISSEREQTLNHKISIKNKTYKVACINMGNPHAVLFTKTPVDKFPLETIGPLVENHKDFPQKTNFEIANIIDSKNIKMRVWERGAGMTLSCGSGACAVFVAARLLGFVEEKAKIQLPGGDLEISWDNTNNPNATVHKEGPAQFCFQGTLTKEQLDNKN